MKKLFAVILILLTLTSCAESGVTDGGEINDIADNAGDADIYWVDSYTTRTDGMYFLKTVNVKNTLCYVDFSNMAEVVVCPKPNCEHNDRETCYALGVTNGMGVVLPHGDKIYWLYYLGYDEGYGSVIYSANADGTARKKVCTIKGRACGSVDALLAVGDTMYFTAESMTFDEHGMHVDDPISTYLYSYNFKSGELREEYDFSEQLSGYDMVNAYIKGAWNGGIYFYATAGNKVIDKINDDGYVSGYHYTHSERYFRYDISEGTLEKPDISPWNISGGYMIFLEGSTVRLVHESGEEYEFKNAGASLIFGAFVVNNKLFISNKVIDIESGKRYERLTDNFFRPIAYIDGQYILAYDKDFTKLPEGKVIGAELT